MELNSKKECVSFARASAGELVLSANTVKTHFEKIYSRLEVCDRPAAVAEGFRRRLLR